MSPNNKAVGNIVDMLLAQSEPKNHKKKRKFGKINGVRYVLKTDGIIPTKCRCY